MREPNLGINRFCLVCGKSYRCDDGDPVCPNRDCQEISENMEEEE